MRNWLEHSSWLMILVLLMPQVVLGDEGSCPAGMNRVKTTYGSMCSPSPNNNAPTAQPGVAGEPAYVNCRNTFQGIELFPVRPNFLQQVKPIAYASCGERVSRMSSDDQYTRIRTSSGLEGYLLSGFLSSSPTQTKVDVQAAAQKVAETLAITYAVQGASDIRNALLDPTSFTLLQVISITKRKKDGQIQYRGCVHYVGSNRMGGRIQMWGGYFVNKKGKLTSGAGTENMGCYIASNEQQADVTEEVSRALF